MTAVVDLIIIGFAIYLLTLVANHFFMTSLDGIAARLKLSPSVAGATLMAAGSSAPELAIAMVALFTQGGAHSDIGIGTIVGSAVFNILVITGVCAVIHTAHITLSAIIRDTGFYLAGIGVMLYVFIDGEITPLEPLLLVGTYGIYLIAVFRFPGDSFEAYDHGPEEIPLIETRRKIVVLWRMANRAARRVVGMATGDPRRHDIRAFLVSIAIIIGLSKLLVDHAVSLSQTIGLPPVVIGLTVLAAGTSAPDLIASMIAVRRGHGDMAVANAIGSNTFDILLGLGLPWLVALCFTGRGVIPVGTSNLLESVLILIGTVLVLFGFLAKNRQLGKKAGITLLLIYAGYVAWIVAGQ